MKLNKLFAAFMLIMAVAFAACEDPEIIIDGPNQKPNDTTTVVEGEAPDTIGWNIPAECLTVAQAREICAKLESGATTGTKYYVKGWVKKLANKHADGISQYNNALFYMEDVKDANSQEDFYAYQVYGLDGAKITHPEAVAVGDYVVVFGELTNYNGTYETVGKGAAYIWKSTNPNLNGSSSSNPPSGEVTGAGTLENPYTAADVLSLNNTKSGNYWVKAYIVGQVNGKSMSSNSEFNAPFSGSSNDDGSVNAYNTNLLIAMSADVADASQCVPVQLPTGALRSGLNLAQNPDMDGKEILLYGSLEAYFSAAGIRSTSYAKVGDKEFGTKPGETPNVGELTGEGTLEKPYTALDVVIMNNAVTGNFYVKAFIVGQLNGGTMSGLELNSPFTPSTNTTTGQQNTYNTNIVIAASVSETDPAKMVPVQLPSGSLRTGLNLPENPEMDGKEILIYGSLEKYCGVAGIKSPSYAVVDGKEFGSKPADITGKELLNETLMSQSSFDKFTAVNVSGDQVWTFDAKYGAKMSGFANNATHPNEDWFMTPALDLTGKTSVTISFDHAFGPAAQVPSTEATKAQYTIWVSNDFESDVKTATWTELKGMVYGTTGWGYVSSGEITIPTENLKANCRIAWKYVCNDVSATWEIKNVIVK